MLGEPTLIDLDRAAALLPPGPAADALAGLHLRVYAADEPGDRTAYVVLDLHGASVGVKRRASDLYLHVDTSETPDQVLAVEINGGGEHEYPVR